MAFENASMRVKNCFHKYKLLWMNPFLKTNVEKLVKSNREYIFSKKMAKVVH